MPINSQETATYIFSDPVYVEARRRRLDNLRAHFDLATLRGGRILELGCGTGELGEAFEEIGCRVVSVDAREEYISAVREKYRGRDAAVMNLDRWTPAFLGRFSAALCFGVLYHLADPEAFLVECTRLTDTVLLESIVLDSPWPECRWITEHEPGGSFSGIGCRPSTAWIINLMDRCGFDVEDISSGAANWFGEYPSVFDWEPRGSGEWLRGNASLRRMLVCRRRHARRSLNVGGESHTVPAAQSVVVPFLQQILGRMDLRGAKVLEVGRAPEGERSALVAAGAVVTSLAELGWDGPRLSGFDAAVLVMPQAVAANCEAAVHRLRCAAPVVLVELYAEGWQYETLFRNLRRAGYYLARQTIERREGGSATVSVFHLREHAANGLSPLLIHVHIPKCAGTSFQRLLQMSFEGRHLDYYPEDQSRCLTRDELVRFVSGNPAMLSCSSHSVRLFPSVVWDRVGLYVAFLREPVRRFISNLTYYQKQQQTFPQCLQRQLPQSCTEMTLRELAGWLLENQSEAVLRSMTMTGFLAEQTWLETVAGVAGVSDRWLDSGSLLYSGFEALQVTVASAVLDKFFFVGLVEEMSTSVQLLREALRPYGLNFAEGPIPVENVSSELATDTGWLNPSDPVGRRVLDLLKPDMELYARFRTILGSRFQANAATG